MHTGSGVTQMSNSQAQIITESDILDVDGMELIVLTSIVPTVYDTDSGVSRVQISSMLKAPIQAYREVMLKLFDDGLKPSIVANVNEYNGGYYLSIESMFYIDYTLLNVENLMCSVTCKLRDQVNPMDVGNSSYSITTPTSSGDNIKTVSIDTTVKL